VARIDRVLVFRPLTRELMRGILAKELRSVLDRRGLRHREWAVEWESSALDFLLDKGFTSALGARPLKRAIDQYLLAPLAATLVEHRFPEGDQFLFVRSDGRGIQVEFVDPNATAPPVAVETAHSSAQLSVAKLMLQPEGSREEHVALQSELSRLEQRVASEEWRALEADLIEQMQRRDFWDRAERHGVLSRYALLDRVKAAKQTARGLEQRLDRSRGRSDAAPSELITRLAAQLYLLEHGIEDALTNAPVEVALAVLPVLDTSADTHVQVRWRERMLDMYRAWATKRRMQWSEVTGPEGPSRSILLVTGFGAARILLREAGLHVLERESQEEGRLVARVAVGMTPATLPDASRDKYLSLAAQIAKIAASSTVVRRYRLDAAPLVRDAQHGWRTGRTDLVMQGDFDLLGDMLGAQRSA
jgi:ATP-dependent Clp protease ATP-binding subunit ClpC